MTIHRNRACRCCEAKRKLGVVDSLPTPCWTTASLGQARTARNSRITQLVALAAQYAVPRPHGISELPLTDELMSYDYSLAEAYRQIGLQVSAYSPRGEAGRPTDPVDKDRNGHQFQGSQGLWPG